MTAERYLRLTLVSVAMAGGARLAGDHRGAHETGLDAQVRGGAAPT